MGLGPLSRMGWEGSVTNGQEGKGAFWILLSGRGVSVGFLTCGCFGLGLCEDASGNEREGDALTRLQIKVSIARLPVPPSREAVASSEEMWGIPGFRTKPTLGTP